MAVAVHSSAAGALSLLSEPEPIIQEHALRTLSPLVPQFWAEISEQIALMSVRIFSIDI
jgi:26S proteasome regulatory subunit N2